MISLAERKCSWCRPSQPSENCPKPCDNCSSKASASNKALAGPHRSSIPLKLTRNFYPKIQRTNQDGSSNQDKEIELEIVDTYDKLCCNCLITGKFLGHQVLTLKKNIQEKDVPVDKSDDSADKFKANVPRVRDEELAEKRDALCRELDHGFQQCFDYINHIEHSLLKNLQEHAKPDSEDKSNSSALEKKLKMIVENKKEDKVLQNLNDLRQEVEIVANDINQWIDSIRGQSFSSKLNELGIAFNFENFQGFLDSICHFGAYNKYINHHEEEKNDRPRRRNEEIKHHNEPLYEEMDSEDALHLIAGNFNIYIKENKVEFDLHSKRNKLERRRRPPKWTAQFVDEIKLTLSCSGITKKTKPCLDYILSRGYFTRLELVIKVDNLNDNPDKKFSNLFAGLSQMKNLKDLSVEIIDSEKAAANSDNSLLDFIRGYLPKGVTKRSVLGGIAMSVSSNLAHSLVKSRKLETLDLQFKYYEIDSDQFISLGREWSCLTHIMSLSVHLRACHLIRPNGLIKFIDEITQQGSELIEADLDVQDCDQIDENSLNKVIKAQSHLFLMDQLKHGEENSLDDNDEEGEEDVKASEY